MLKSLAVLSTVVEWKVVGLFWQWFWSRYNWQIIVTLLPENPHLPQDSGICWQQPLKCPAHSLSRYHLRISLTIGFFLHIFSLCKLVDYSQLTFERIQGNIISGSKSEKMRGRRCLLALRVRVPQLLSAEKSDPRDDMRTIFTFHTDHPVGYSRNW